MNPRLLRERVARVMARALVALLLALTVMGGFQADTTVVDPTGRVIMVEVVQDPESSDQGLVYTEQTPQGQTQTTEPINYTIDPVIDDSPALALNPSGGIVVVWSRHDGNDSELMLARRENGVWSAPRALTSNATADTQARVLVGAQDIAHIVWWGNGEGGPFYLRSFDVLTGQPVGPRQEPLNAPRTAPRPVRSGNGSSYNQAGGMDEPGIPSAAGNLATALPCPENPAAAPAHGVVMACGEPAAFQLSACQLTVGVRDPLTMSWRQTVANLSMAPLDTTPVVALVQSLADFSCHQP